MENLLIVMFLFWPAVAVICAGLNMLITWTFSWSELVFVYLAGIVAGYFLFAGVEGAAGVDGDLHAAVAFFFVFSHGLFAWLYMGAEGFREVFGSPQAFLWAMAGIRVGATVWAAAWDHASEPLGARLGWAPALFSFLVAPAKLPFALVTSAVGLAIWVAGVAWATFGRGKAGFAGGVFFTEFAPGGGGHHATTVGFTVHTWVGNTPWRHELYHTRQYIYLSDWLIPFWCLGIIWGAVSALIDKQNVTAEVAFGAIANSEVGNPIEVAAHRL